MSKEYCNKVLVRNYQYDRRFMQAGELLRNCSQRGGIEPGRLAENRIAE